LQIFEIEHYLLVKSSNQLTK